MTKTRGRPRLNLTSKDFEKVRTLASQGIYEKDIARCLGIHPNYLPELKRRNPALQDAIETGNSEGLAFATEKLMEEIGSRNLKAIIFYLRCKHGWSDSGEKGKEPENRATATERILQNIKDFKKRNESAMSEVAKQPITAS